MTSRARVFCIVIRRIVNHAVVPISIYYTVCWLYSPYENGSLAYIHFLWEPI